MVNLVSFKFYSFFWSILVLFMLCLMMIPLMFFILYFGKAVYLVTFIFNMDTVCLNFPFIVDVYGVVVSFVVCFISMNVYMFAKTYMMYDEFNSRFNIILLLFILSMNLLVYIPSLPILLLGWDGLGLSSFLLIIFYQNYKCLSGGMFTALSNRLGDAMVLAAIGLMMNNNSWYIMNIWESSYPLLVFLIIFTAMTKSAHFPFSSWLPAAMAAPTPVSALVHSSTLVTAGVFLLVRFNVFLQASSLYTIVLLLTSTITMMMAAINAMFEWDMKKVIALSTLSQLGVMSLSLSMNLPKLALFHLVTHAMFKALLFVCAGSVIFVSGHNQDLRLIGGLSSQTMFVGVGMSIGGLALSGMPFLSGFYSKDLIIESMMSSNFNFLMMSLIIISTGMTAYYSVRLNLLVLWGVVCSAPSHNVVGEDMNIIIPVFMLSVGAVFIGSVTMWEMGPVCVFVPLVLYVKVLALFLGLLGGLVGYMMSSVMSSGTLLHKFLFVEDLVTSMWFITPVSTQYPLSLLNFSYKYIQVVDHGWLETFGGEGLNKSFTKIGLNIGLFQVSELNRYMYMSGMLMMFLLMIYI